MWFFLLKTLGFFLSGFKGDGNPALRPLYFAKFDPDDVFLLGYNENEIDVTVTQKEYLETEEQYLNNVNKVFVILKCQENLIKLDNLISTIES